MGASFSSGKNQSADGAASTSAPTNGSSSDSTKTPKTPSRASRRITKSDPSIVNFKSNPRDPTPQLKKKPLTPKSRTTTADKMKSAVRKSSRFSKYKMPKHQGAPKYSAKLSYDVDEMVYIWEKKVLYEARIVKREGSKYKVHFVGYKNNKRTEKWYTTDDMMGKE